MRQFRHRQNLEGHVRSPARGERRRRGKEHHSRSVARSDERKRLLGQSWRDSCALGKAIFGSSAVAKGYAFRRGLAIFLASHLASQSRLLDRFEISRATTDCRRTQARSQGRPPSIDRIACPSRGAQPNRPKLIPRGARIDGPHNLRRRSRLRSIHPVIKASSRRPSKCRPRIK